MRNSMRYRWWVLGAWCALLAISGPVTLAQAWRGTTAFDVEILRQKKPAEGVEVLLVFLELDAKAGPAPVVTNARGIATLEGLAQGRWRIELRADGKSPYSAVIQLTAGEKTVVVAGPVRDAAAPAMTVKLSRGRLSSGTPPAVVTPVAPPAERPKPALEPRPTPEPKAPAKPTLAPKPERAPPVDAPSPSTAPPPSSAVVDPTKPVAPPSSPPPQPAAITSAIEPPAAAPPPKAISPPPIASPPAAPSAVGRGTAGIVAQCPECKAGEKALAVVQVAGEAQGACAADEAIGAAIERLGAADAVGSLRGFIGALVDPATGQLPGAVAGSVATEVLALLAPFLDPNGPCQLLVAVLPPESRYSGYAYEVSDRNGSGGCLGSESCEIGQAAWLDHPVIRKTPEATFLFAIFRNLSPNLERRAKLVVYFRP